MSCWKLVFHLADNPELMGIVAERFLVGRLFHGEFVFDQNGLWEKWEHFSQGKGVRIWTQSLLILV